MRKPSLERSRRAFARSAWAAVCVLALVAPATRAVAADDDPPPIERQPRPVPVTVLAAKPGIAPGLLFIAPQSGAMAYQHGPQILDNQGRPVWFRHITDGTFATNFEVQNYRGEQVLTWWEGSADDTGRGWGVGYIANRNYQIIATVSGSTESPLDFHEFRLTPQGTALVILARVTSVDLTPYGGPADAKVRENGFREVDVATGRVLHEWWSLDHVPVTESNVVEVEGAWNYFHMNSVTLDTDGNYLVSGRHTSTVYKIDRHTGAIIWRLGGKSSDFQFGPGAKFGWQHDVEAAGHNTYRIFDNASSPLDPTAPHLPARVVWVKADPVHHTATLQREILHPDAISVAVEGGSSVTPSGNTVVSYGSGSRVSEFDARGRLVFDAALPDRHSTYRAYRFPWHARPLEEPTVTETDDGTVHAVWNGATDVARWRVLGGGNTKDLRPLTQTAWNGLDTSVTLPGGVHPLYLKVQALDSHNRVIGASAVTAAGQSQGG